MLSSVLCSRSTKVATESTSCCARYAFDSKMICSVRALSGMFLTYFLSLVFIRTATTLSYQQPCNWLLSAAPLVKGDDRQWWW